MAARERNWTPDKVRQKIRTSMLINRLQGHVLGRIEMSKTQVQAAGMLLRKTLPDMIAQTVTLRPLEQMADDELLATLHAIRGYLTSQGIGAGMDDTREPARLISLSTVQ
jgi:hypothetical protein